TTHASAKKNRESMYAFFQKYLNNPGDSTDLEVELLSDELQVTKTGQVATSFKDAETVFSLNRKDTKEDMDHLAGLRKSSDYLTTVLKYAKDLSGYQKPEEYHKPVFTGRYQESGYVIEKYFMKGEGDYVIPYLLMIPDHSNGKAVICLNPGGKSKEIENGDAAWFVRNGFTVLLPDLLGIGELGSGDYKGDSYVDNTSYGVWYLSILIGRSIVGVRAGDVTRLVDVLKKRNDLREVYGLARNTMSSVLLYAAAFDQRVKRICLVEPLSSYRSLLMHRLYEAQFIYSAVAGALKFYDLPDLAASLSPRRLTMVDVVDGQNKLVEKKEDISA